MFHLPQERIYQQAMTRRDFLWLTSLTTLTLMTTDCAVNPVTGQRQLMLVSESQEVAIDQENAPHQFSADYGTVQNSALNNYINQVGQGLAARSHRPQMPYSFQAVNATYANAYTFPAGSVGVTRGILVTLNNEAELAALLSHEIAHVNARHTAEQMSKNLAIGLGLAVGLAYISTSDKYQKYSDIAAIAGQVGASLLLARYSRDNEREADALGMEYMTRLGYNPTGMVGLMELLISFSKQQPGFIETMFASHPMSQERYQNARQRLTAYRSSTAQNLQTERYQDQIADLRRIKSTLNSLQNGDELFNQKRYSEAEVQFKTALRQTPNDYAGLVMMAKCQLAQEKTREAYKYAKKAQSIYPQEAQAYHIEGLSLLEGEQPEKAYEAFHTYEQRLPGNPNTVFFKAISLENMQDKKGAAQEYSRYLDKVPEGEQATHARQRLKTWGYLKTP